jgi:hypothetical protein
LDIPSLNENQFAVGKAALGTGHILKNDGEIFKIGENINEMYEVFESYEEAIEFSLQKIKSNPEIECWIVDGKGNHVITFDINGERKYSTPN